MGEHQAPRALESQKQTLTGAGAVSSHRPGQTGKRQGLPSPWFTSGAQQSVSPPVLKSSRQKFCVILMLKTASTSPGRAAH